MSSVLRLVSVRQWNLNFNNMNPKPIQVPEACRLLLRYYVDKWIDGYLKEHPTSTVCIRDDRRWYYPAKVSHPRLIVRRSQDSPPLVADIIITVYEGKVTKGKVTDNTYMSMEKPKKNDFSSSSKE